MFPLEITLGQVGLLLELRQLTVLIPLSGKIMPGHMVSIGVMMTGKFSLPED